MNNPTVLVVDDDSEIREVLDEYLTSRCIRVLLAADGSEMKSILARQEVDIVLLDLNLPGENGIDLTRQLSSESNVGIIIVTAVADPEDRVLGLETGADDYVIKPFNLRELLARIHSVLRRYEGSNKFGPVPVNKKFSGWVVSDNGELNHDDGRRTVLSTGELDLLDLLLQYAGEPVSREQLLKQSSHRELEAFDRSIDVRIARLRRKVESDPAHPRIIRTVRNVGYALVIDERAMPERR